MDPNSWQDCGFPNIHFRTAYLPWVGLVKALNERLAIVQAQQREVPGYFTRQIVKMLYYCDEFDRFGLQSAVGGNRLFVNPDKIPSATSVYDCYWTYSDLLLAAAGGVEGDIVTTNIHHLLMPEFPVKWAIQRYNAINLLRYVRTKTLSKWPYVEYEDRNNTYNFKAPEP